MGSQISKFLLKYPINYEITYFIVFMQGFLVSVFWFKRFEKSEDKEMD